ncbi:MAG: MFS transporter [Chloroflexota bacterium]
MNNPQKSSTPDSIRGHRPSSTEPTTAEKIQKLPWGVAAYATNTVFVQFTFFGSAFVLLLNQIGFSKGQIGLIFSFFPYTGLIALFIAPRVARFGYKRTYLTFFTARKLVTAGLLLIPWLMAQFGFQVTLIYVYTIALTFALCRAVGETGYYPWHQEYVPSSVRGKFSANNNMFSTLTGFVAVALASLVIEQSTGLNGYMLLIAVGILFGLLSLYCSSHVPGGAPVPADDRSRQGRDLWQALRDGNFVRYLLGAGCITLAITPLAAFLPLFMQEQVGLSEGNVILIQTGTLLGGLLSTYWWGWAADRYGSKPAALLGSSFLLLLPLLWLAMPRFSPLSLYAALAIALLQGVASMGWLIGSARLFHVSVVPPAQKGDYMALHYAWMGILGGTSQLLGGQLVEAGRNLSGQVGIFTIDPYSGLFALGLIGPLLSLLLLRPVRDDGRISVGEFAFMFLRGNPFRAMSSLMGYYWAKNEQTAVLVTERLGQANSPLTVEELLQALADPRFNVRFEAIISIARMRPNPRLTAALEQVLQGTELALTVVAAWALGRIGDPTAVSTLRAGLDSPYRSVRAHCARALGTLGDATTAPLLHDRLVAELDKGLQMAYAAALGNMGHTAAVPDLLRLLAHTQNEGARLELVLGLARLLGEEHHTIQLWRQVNEDVGTALSTTLTSLSRKLPKGDPQYETLLAHLSASADAFARQELAQGTEALQQLVTLLPSEGMEETAVLILNECRRQLQQHGQHRLDYILLTLHVLAVSAG